MIGNGCYLLLVIQISIPEVRLDTLIFLAFLEYLYTDHSPIEDSDSIGILELANQYVMPRLTIHSVNSTSPSMWSGPLQRVSHRLTLTS